MPAAPAATFESEPPISSEQPRTPEPPACRPPDGVSPHFARLHAVATALAGATTTGEVVDAVTRVALPACGAAVALFYRLSDDGTELACVYDSGLSEARHEKRYRLDEPTPVSVAARAREALWFESRDELLAQFPEVRPYIVAANAVAIMPLVMGERVAGAFVLGYRDPERFDPDRRAFLAIVASLCAQALERARLFDEERRARAVAESAHGTLQALVQSAPLALALLDAGANVRLWNPAAERMTGYRRDEALDRHLPGVTEERRAELACRLGNGAQFAGDEAVHVRRSGEPYDVALWSAPVRAPDGERLSLLMMADVTERNRATEAPRRLAEATRVLASSLDFEETMRSLTSLAVPWLADCAVVDELGSDGVVRRVAIDDRDPCLRERLDSTSQSLREGGGRPITEALLRHESVLTRELDEAHLERLGIDADRRRAILALGIRSAVCVPLAARGRVFGALSLLYGKSGRRHGADDRRAAEELARRAGIALDNARTYQEAQKAIALRDDFVSLASHELKTPLTSLSLHAQAIAQALRRQRPDDPLLDRLVKLDRQISRLDQIVDSLLDISHLSGDLLELDPGPTDLAALAREVAGRAAGDVAHAGATLTVRAAGPVVGEWDRRRLEQVVTILLSNAIKYGAAGPIELAVVAVAERAWLTVRDHGIGIAVEDQARIFERFERAVSRQHYGGFGLGLWGASRIVTASGGTLRVESAPGAGAAFTVELPR